MGRGFGIGNRGMGGQGGGRNAEVPGLKPSLDLTTAIPDFALIDLNLNSDQASRINLLRDALLRDLKPLQGDVSKKRLELKLIWTEYSPYDEKISVMQKDIKNE